MTLLTRRVRAPRPEPEPLLSAKEGLEGGVSKLQTAGSIVSIVARFGGLDEDDEGVAATSWRLPAAAPHQKASDGGALFDTRAAVRAAVRGLEGEKGQKGDFLRSASAYFGHEVAENTAAARSAAAAPAPPSSSSPQPFVEYEQAKPYRKNLSAAEAPPYTIFPNITHGYRSGGTYLRCIGSLVRHRERAPPRLRSRSPPLFFPLSLALSLTTAPPTNPKNPKQNTNNSSSSTPRRSTRGPPSSATSSASPCSS
jgi:hypothetical protein